MPWIINLLTLQSIARFIQFPAEFIHYLSRRLRLNMIKKVHAIEELDYFGDYLTHGLFFEDAEIEPYTDVALDGCTEKIEAYRRYEKGLSDIPVEKPQQTFPTEFRTILADLQKINSPVSLQVSLSLLEMSGKARADIAEAICDCRQKTAEDGGVHDFSTRRKDDECGFTFVSTNQASAKHLPDRLAALCRWKFENTPAKHWNGIGSIIGNAGIAHQCVILER